MLENVSIDHGGADILVAEQFLNSADVVSALEQMSGKAMAKGVAGDALFDSGFGGGFLDGSL